MCEVRDRITLDGAYLDGLKLESAISRPAWIRSTFDMNKKEKLRHGKEVGIGNRSLEEQSHVHVHTAAEHGSTPRRQYSLHTAR